MSWAVETHELTKTFGSFTAVDRVSMSVEQGEIFGFLGANGAGKTTTIRMLCGLLRPSSGKGMVGGYDIDRETEKVKHVIGYMSQKFSLYEDLTVEQNLTFFGGVYGLRKQELATRRAEVIAMMGLKGGERTLVRALPLGFKQRLALSSAVIHHPRILFLDEPTGGVDPVARRLFWDMIYAMADQGTTVFVTTHYMDEAEYCHRIIIMHQGQIIATGSPEELKRLARQSTMEEVFIELVRARALAEGESAP